MGTNGKTVAQEARTRLNEQELLKHLHEAEQKAWESLGKYKFQMFGYWAAIWVHLNKIGKLQLSNPWHELVKIGREQTALIHHADIPFQAICGADIANQRTTRDVGSATCWKCKSILKKGAL